MSMVPCAELAFLLTRQPRQSHPVRRLSLPAHEAASAVPPVRSPGLPAHETASAVPPVRSPGPPAHETASAVPPVRRPGLPAHETASAVLSVRRPGPPAHEEDQNKAFVRERVTLRTRGLWNPFLSPGRIAGHSRVALWPYCHLHEEFRLCWQTEIGADELDF